MAYRNNPVVAILNSNSLEAIGLREVVLRAKPKATVLLYNRVGEFLGDDVECVDILCVEESALVLFGDKLRNKKCQIIPIIRHSISTAETLSLSYGDSIFLCSEWSEEELRKRISGAFAQSQAKKEKQEERGLSRRELDVLKEVARGLTNKEIADKLNISMNTVMTHRKNITAKLNIKTVSGLTFYALMNNYISGDEMENKGAE